MLFTPHSRSNEQRVNFIAHATKPRPPNGTFGVQQRYGIMKICGSSPTMFFLAVAVTFGVTGVASADSAALVNALKRIDNSVCRSFKATCKTKPKARMKKPVGSGAAKAETPKVAPKIVPPLPREKPLMEPLENASVPVPRMKPQKSAVIMPDKPSVVPPDIPRQDSMASGGDKDCLQKLRAEGANFTIAAGVADMVVAGALGNEVCHVQNPVRVHAVKVNSYIINLPESPLLNCHQALQFSKWLRESAAPILAAQLGTPLAKVSTGPGYECRGRNGDVAAKISEHGRGNAVDITTFTMQNGKIVTVADAQTPSASTYTVLRGLRASACGYFTTVLGPGSNAAHAAHFHFDIGIHGKSGNYRICE